MTKSPDRKDDAVRGYRPGDGRGDRDGVRSGRNYDRGYIRQRGKRFNWGPNIAFYFYDGYYYGDCDWLRRKARQTGSDYWLRRYRQCRAW